MEDGGWMMMITSRSSVFCGQPSTEKGKSPELNQVSSTSGSWVSWIFDSGTLRNQSRKSADRELRDGGVYLEPVSSFSPGLLLRPAGDPVAGVGGVRGGGPRHCHVVGGDPGGHVFQLYIWVEKWGLPVAPPQLAGDTPVTHTLHPVGPRLGLD